MNDLTERQKAKAAIARLSQRTVNAIALRTLLLGRLYNEQKSENHENRRKNAEGQNVPPVNHAAVLSVGK